MCLSGLDRALPLLIRPAAAPSPSGSNNPTRIKGKPAFFSLWNICLSGLDKALPLLNINHMFNLQQEYDRW
ncbi:hypothetical protein FZC80_19520 [Rossellomorea aquimaris]|uniref:Uncharacterized protein n=1 Tax=Rossellomorea aquimaris TaxID=189382 RepID=A0A5D4TF49_9BACI|nr:hypothetical protein FZC80_19520 [Rossellomorea aquimaris]